jgi:hypothetical protein
MSEIEYDGFVARVYLREKKIFRGEVQDTHEPVVIEGVSVAELYSDLKMKVDAYKQRCARRGLQPFATPDGKPTAVHEAPIDSEDISRDHPAWPHRHHHFYDGKAWSISDSLGALEKVEFRFIPSKARLPIDDLVDRLRERSRSPRLADFWRAPEGAKDLNLIVRFELREAFFAVSKADPRNRIDARDDAHQFIEDAQRLQSELNQFLRTYRSTNATFPTFARGLEAHVSSERLQIVLSAEQHLRALAHQLSDMIGWAFDDLDDHAPAYGGRPRLSWKYDFVAGMAKLWFLLTHKEPSSSAGSLFIEFVEAGWLSGGEDMPQVGWEDIVRTYVRGLRKAAKKGENPSFQE